MKLYDYQQVNSVLGPLRARFADCAHGEGSQCVTLDKNLECCADICFAVANALRQWAREVFTGEVLFDSQTENQWRAEAGKILSEAIRLWQLGHKAELPCHELPGQNKLASALWELHWLLDKWVSPKLAVGPAARTKLDPSVAAAMRIQLSNLCAIPVPTSNE